MPPNQQPPDPERDQTDESLGAERHLTDIVERGVRDAALERDRTRAALDQVAEGARRQVVEARVRSEATMREIAGQGPEKTLGRGFAVVRAEDGTTLTGVDAARAAGQVQIEFRDGRLPARVRTEEGSEGR